MKKIVSKSSLYGDPNAGTKVFDDHDVYMEKGYVFPSAIIVRKGAIIDKVGFLYNGQELSHGGNGGGLSTYQLEKGEYIVKVTGCFSAFGGKQTLQQIQFYTDKGRKMGSGENRNGNMFFEYAVEEGKAICCMFGMAGKYVNCIGFHAITAISKGGGGFPEMNLPNNPFKK